MSVSVSNLNLPKPSRRTGQGRGRTYNFDRIAVGSAVRIADDSVTTATLLKRVSGAAYRWARGAKAKVSIRVLDDGAVGVWREQ